ncbi:MAG: CRISPR system precrRNA processing endoribonuclease RAMP protein Cas6 [Pyrodictiaceae archaeon]
MLDTFSHMQSSGDACAYRVDVEFTVRRPIPVAVWSGMYLYRELLTMLEHYGVKFHHRGVKPFTISPILDADGVEYMDTGILEPGEAYRFRFSTADLHLLEAFRRAIGGGNDYLDVIRVGIRKVDLATNQGKTPRRSKYLATVRLRFLPTLFKFRSFEVLYPSPHRFLLSVLRDFYRITGTDLRALLQRVMLETELILDKTRVFRLCIGRDGSGRERCLRAFRGEAVYAILIKGDYLHFITKLFELAGALGVGKNRSIGLGHVDIIGMKVKELS